MRAGFLCLVLGASLAIGCGDDDGTDATDAPGDDMGTSPAEDMGTTPAEDMGTTPAEDMGPTPELDMGMGPPEDMGIASAAAAFCAEFETSCGYDGANVERYDDEAACLAYYEAAPAGCVTCIDTHLMNVMTMGVSHCPHAVGMGPCAGPCP